MINKEDLKKATKEELIMLLGLQEKLINLILESLVPVAKLKVEREFCVLYIKQVTSGNYINDTENSIKEIQDFLIANESKFSEKFSETRKQMQPQVITVITSIFSDIITTLANE